MTGKRGKKSGKAGRGASNNNEAAIIKSTQVDTAKENSLTNDNDNMLHLFTQAVKSSWYPVEVSFCCSTQYQLLSRGHQNLNHNYHHNRLYIKRYNLEVFQKNKLLQNI
jgi:hypothetical protein